MMNRWAGWIGEKVFLRSRRLSQNGRRLIVPFSFLVSVLILGSGAAWYVQYRQFADQKSVGELELMVRDFHSLISQQAKGLSIALAPIVQNKQLKASLTANDKAALLAQWGPVYERMRKDGVSHFYILDANRVCLLRVHQPARAGDVIERFTARQADVLGRRSWGIELGVMGTFTLRVVEPVYDGQKVIGYVELGKEIEDVIHELYFHFGHDIVLMIDKNFIDRSAWEEGMRMLERPLRWEANRDMAVSFATSEAMVEVFGAVADRSHSHVARGEPVRWGEGRYEISYLPVHDVSGKEVAHMQVIRETSREHREFLQSVTGIGAVLLLLWMSILWMIRTLLLHGGRIREECVSKSPIHDGKEGRE